MLSITVLLVTKVQKEKRHQLMPFFFGGLTFRWLVYVKEVRLADYGSVSV